MAQIAPEAIYTKTAKGILEIRDKTVRLPRELGLVFLSVDGKASVGELLPRSGMTGPQFQHALTTLVTDGYIKVVTAQSDDAAVDPDALDFTAPQAVTQVNMEAASRALAEAEATKRAQQESRAAMEARVRQDTEARARALAESRADAEAEARVKAEEAARAATEERAQAELEAARATDPGARAQAESRARAAASAAARAEAEARSRGEAEERARALAETKRAAEEQAREEAEARSRSESQAQARAQAEARARTVLEAQVEAMRGASAYADDPKAREGDAARARVRELEQEAERAREAARATAEAEGRAHEEPQPPELDIADRVRQLNARVQAERQAREKSSRVAQDIPAVDFKPVESTAPPAASAAPPDGSFPSLQLPDLDAPTPERAAPSPAAAAPAPEPSGGDLPVVDMTKADVVPLPAHPEQHVQSALERAMAQVTTRKEEEAKAPPPAPQMSPREAAAAKTSPSVFVPRAAAASAPPATAEAPAAVTEGEPAPAATVEPTLVDADISSERVNLDRAAHDAIADRAETVRKTEAATASREAVALRARRQEEERRRSAEADRARARRKFLAGTAIVLFAAIAGVTAYLQFTPLKGYIPDAQRALSQRLGQPVLVQSVRYVLLPTPRLVLDGITIGKTEGLRILMIEAHALPHTLFGESKRFGTAAATGVTIDPGMLATIPAWTGGRSADSVHVDRLVLNDVKIDVPNDTLGTFGGEVEFAANGTLTQAVIKNEAMKLELAPHKDGFAATFEASNWKPPVGPQVEFTNLNVKGVTTSTGMTGAQFEGRFANGGLQGTFNARWAGPVAIDGTFTLENAQFRDLAEALMPSFAARGTTRVAGRYSLQGDSAAALIAGSTMEGKFSVARGELTNIDLVRGIQMPGAAAFRGGRTGFEELSGAFQISGGRYAYRNVQLTSGPLNATATLDVSPTGELNGRLNAELASKGGVVARQALAIGGTVRDPQLRR